MWLRNTGMLGFHFYCPMIAQTLNTSLTILSELFFNPSYLALVRLAGSSKLLPSWQMDGGKN